MDISRCSGRMKTVIKHTWYKRNTKEPVIDLCVSLFTCQAFKKVESVYQTSYTLSLQMKCNHGIALIDSVQHQKKIYVYEFIEDVTMLIYNIWTIKIHTCW